MYMPDHPFVLPSLIRLRGARGRSRTVHRNQSATEEQRSRRRCRPNRRRRMRETAPSAPSWRPQHPEPRPPDDPPNRDRASPAAGRPRRPRRAGDVCRVRLSPPVRHGRERHRLVPFQPARRTGRARLPGRLRRRAARRNRLPGYCPRPGLTAVAPERRWTALPAAVLIHAP